MQDAILNKNLTIVMLTTIRHPGESRELRLQRIISKVSRAAWDPGFRRDDGVGGRPTPILKHL
jgi:hypothetical protein